MIIKLIRYFALLALIWLSPAAHADDTRIVVNVSGIDTELALSLIQGLSLESHKTNSRLSERYVQTLYEDGFDELKTMLTVFGYYQAKVFGKIVTEEEQWHVTYEVELGPPVFISTLNIEISGDAQHDLAFDELLSAFPIEVGQQLDHQNYEKAKKDILRLAARRGYFDGKMTTSSVKVNTETSTAVITFVYDAGIRYQFASLSFPDTIVSKSLLQQLVPFPEATPYSTDDVLNLRSRLTNSGYFESVTITTGIEKRVDGKVPLDIELQPKAKHLYTAGIGYGTDTGARLALGWENRFVNQRGHRLNSKLSLSQVSNSLSADYVMPFWSKTINSLGATTEFKQEETDTSESESFAVGTYYQRQRWNWDELGSLKLMQEDFDISDESESALLLIPGVTWSRTWADDTLYTKQGGRLSFSFSGASESLLSDISFVQAVVRGKYIQSFGDSSRLITRGTLGATEVSDFEKFPSSLRFFTGGDNTIRGFDYETLGPKNSEGDVVGGRYQVVGSVEYENMLWGDWGAALFSDFGNAFNSFSDPIEYSVGIGVRWRSPVGLIRVDVAKALSEQEEPITLHIVIGPDL